jgi:hypothetical protein
LVVTALANLAGVNLTSTATFQRQRNLEYAADGATNTAIEVHRYQNPKGGTCAPLTLSVNGIVMSVDCGTWAPTPNPGQWSATFKARYCSAPCTAPPVLTAVVVYNDFDSAGNPQPGSTVEVQSWVVNSANA